MKMGDRIWSWDSPEHPLKIEGYQCGVFAAMKISDLDWNMESKK